MDYNLDVEDLFDDNTPQSSAPASSNENKEKRRLTTHNGEIGYMKGDNFHAMTNFSVVCTGYVTKDIGAKNAEGFLIDVIPKDSVRISEEDIDEATSVGDLEERYKELLKSMYYICIKHRQCFYI